LTAYFLCSNNDLPFKATSGYPAHDHSRRILRVQPTWELERRSLPSETGSSIVKFSEARRIFLRIHYNRKLQEGDLIDEEELVVSVAFEDICKFGDRLWYRNSHFFPLNSN